MRVIYITSLSQWMTEHEQEGVVTDQILLNATRDRNLREAMVVHVLKGCGTRMKKTLAARLFV